VDLIKHTLPDELSMPDQVAVIIGPARCGKTRWLLGQYRQTLRRGMADAAVGRLLWLAPTARAASAVRRQLIAGDEATRPLDACLDPGVTTFARLADAILSSSLGSPRAIRPPAERELVRRVIRAAQEKKTLGVLADAARRPSFVDVLVDHFRELKRRGVGPDEFAKIVTPRDDRQRHEPLSRLYADYERRLATHRLADLESRPWAACDALAADEPTRFDALALVVADGFTDFTHAQYELLRQLARRAKRLLISLPGDAEQTASRPDSVGRGDLFAKSSATLAELRRRHPQLLVEPLPARATGFAAIDHLERNVFRHPRDVEPPDDAAIASLDRIEIVPAAGVQQEVVQLARIIKRRLADGARPDEIVVVFRRLREAAPRVREVFAEFGIPAALEAGVPLAATGLVRTLLALLRLDAENWPFRRVVAVATNNMLSAIDRPARAATDWLVRELQVAEGRRELIERVEQLAALAEPDTPKSDAGPRQRRATSAAIALPVLRRLADALDDLPESAPPTLWLAALERLAASLGIAGDLRSPETADQAAPLRESRLAWQSISTQFAAVERLADWLDEPPPALPRDELIALLVDVATHESLPRSADDVGRVRVLSAATARTVEAKHLMLAGMSEQAFPSPERQGRFYTEAEYRRLANASEGNERDHDPLALARSHEEMLLFYDVLTRATERLTISYPALDEKAQSLPASPYVTELERIVGLDRLPPRSLLRPSPLPADATPLSPADWRVLAVHQALDGDEGLLAGMFQTAGDCPNFSESARKNGTVPFALAAASLDAALRIVAARGDRDKFGSAEGLLVSDAVRARLARRFGPQHLWSPSQWERYARCPYHYFMQDVLGLEPLGELVLETDHLRRGSRLHRVLAEFHRRLAVALAAGRTPSQTELAELEREFAQVAQQVVTGSARSGVDAALAEIDRRQIDKWGHGYFEQLGKYDATWSALAALDEPPAPAHFEFRFGPPLSGDAEDDDGDDPRSTSLPFVLDVGKEQIRITGRIDRIDVGRGRDGRLVFNVIDYKSGHRPTLSVDRVESGERLQPALYVMAAQAMLFGEDRATPLWAGYWSMDKGVTTDARFSLKCASDDLQPSDAWNSLQSKVVERVGQFVADIRHGDFPVASRDDHCTSHCPFATVCRVAQVRSLAKPWWPDEPLTPDS
jgi:ATP-dependent helicase/DNAse subunit B